MSKKSVIGTTSVGVFSSILLWDAYRGWGTGLAWYRSFTVKSLCGISPCVYRGGNRSPAIRFLAGLF